MVDPDAAKGPKPLDGHSKTGEAETEAQPKGRPKNDRFETESANPEQAPEEDKPPPQPRPGKGP